MRQNSIKFSINYVEIITPLNTIYSAENSVAVKYLTESLNMGPILMATKKYTL